jgi:hypothetical protein
MATSFPFLALARRWGLPYGEIIRLVEAIQHNAPTECAYPFVIEDVTRAMNEEQERRKH